MRLTLSVKGMRTVDRRGVEAVVRALRGRGERLMAGRDAVRPVVKLRFTAGTGYTYITRKNRRTPRTGWC